MRNPSLRPCPAAIVAAVAALSLAGAISRPAHAQDLFVTYTPGTSAAIARITPLGAASVLTTSPGNLTGLASDANKTIYVGNNNGGAASSYVAQIDQLGHGAITAFQVPFPQGLAFDTAGNLYAANDGGDGITKIVPFAVPSSSPGPNTSAFVASGSGLNGTQGLAFDGNGNLFAANALGNNISKITPGGVVTTFANVVNPFGLAFDRNGNLYAASKSGNSISMISATGVVSTFFSGTLLNNPYGLAFDAAGNLYVANNGSGNILKITADGSSASVFASGLRNARYLAFGGALIAPAASANAPEPSALALCILPALGALIVRRRNLFVAIRRRK